VFSKAGCNQGICHGNANGKGGLKISLRGQDPAPDFEVLVRGGGGRRIHRSDPTRSLLLAKPSGGVPHLGGIRFAVNSLEYRTLLRWIEEGATSDLANAPELVRLTVTPTRQVLYAGPRAGSGKAVQLRVTASFADGTSQDVTKLACYESSSDGVSVDHDGLAQSPGGGEAGINVRYGTKMQTVQLVFVPANRKAFSASSLPIRNYVDRLVLQKLQLVRIPPSSVADDSTFLRRACIDGLGFTPEPAETISFLNECRDERSRTGAPVAWQARAALVDRILARPEFTDFWVMRWADLLRAEERTFDPQGMPLFYAWMRESFGAGRGLDQWVRTVLTSTGSTYDNPAGFYYRRTRTPDLLAENTAQLFMGVRMGCARCHNHPYDRWKQNDYHSLAAYFARVVRETKYKPRRMRFDAEEIHGDEIIACGTSGEWYNPTTGQSLPPKMLDDVRSVPAEGQDRRVALAEWLTRPDNPYFARLMANRIWAAYIGRGIVDPVDDFRDSNPPSNAPLLAALTQELIDSKFDLRAVTRTIMNSATYQLSSIPTAANRQDENYFSHVQARRLSAEQLLETMSVATGAPGDYPGYARGTRITRVVPTWQPNSFLRVFGQPPRETVCDCERSGEATLAQSFELISGRTIDAMLRVENNRLKPPPEPGNPAWTVEELYLAALCRYPTAAEARLAAETARKDPGGRKWREDLCWVLMNTREFLLRH
jgi:hypothetical protein